MLKFRLVVLALTVFVGACSGDAVPVEEEFVPSAVVLLDGGGQIGQVKTAPVSSIYASTIGDDTLDFLPDTIAFQVTGDTVPVSNPSSISEPTFGLNSMSNAQAAWGVQFEVVEGCGDSFISNPPLDSLNIAKTLWEKPGANGLSGTLPSDLLHWWVVEGDSVWAAECPMTIRYTDGSTFNIATSAVSYFEPGPAVDFDFDLADIITVGDTVDLVADGAVDVYGNALPDEWIQWSGGDVYVADAERWDTISATIQTVTKAVEVVVLNDLMGWEYTLTCQDAPVRDMAFTVNAGEVGVERSHEWPVWNREIAGPGWLIRQGVGSVQVTHAETGNAFTLTADPFGYSSDDASACGEGGTVVTHTFRPVAS